MRHDKENDTMYTLSRKSTELYLDYKASCWKSNSFPLLSLDGGFFHDFKAGETKFDQKSGCMFKLQHPSKHNGVLDI